MGVSPTEKLSGSSRAMDDEGNSLEKISGGWRWKDKNRSTMKDLPRNMRENKYDRE